MSRDDHKEEQSKSPLLSRDLNTSQLRSEIGLLKKIIADIPGNVFWKNADGIFLGCNNNVARILGLSSPEDIIGKTNKDLFNTDLANKTDEIDNLVLTAGKEVYTEEEAFSIDRQPATYLTKKNPIFDHQGNVVGMLGLSVDITERKKMENDLILAKEKAEASNRAKTQFLAVMNHELRTPISSILGLVNFLKKDDLSSHDKKTIIVSIENCTEHLLNLVNDVLDFSRLETGSYKLRLKKININVLIQEVFNILKSLAESKNLELIIDVSENSPQNVITDARVLRQILMNLIGNAIKFTEKGHITIQVNSHVTASKKIHLELSVIDTGIGIPADKLDDIFNPFHQLEDAYTRQSSRNGTGLGLTIVKRFAKLIDAKIHVSSEHGKGSTFTLAGDFENGEQSNTEKKKLNSINKNILTKKPANASTPIFPGILPRKPFILLVEDDPIVQYVHKKMLLDLGCEVDAVTHGLAALNRLNHHHDIIFVDISLPDISGFDVIKKIREREETKDIPIIALTVYTGKEERDACINVGANEFKSKPILQFALQKILLRYLK